ncbi:MAG: type IX secretion system membrane protein PorP/SprF [Sphingobacteriia bacterium]|nr:MAG: type IX secretion system membrane protein PorP/SprF [Sphingobacteriia bacterium]TAG30886.1 MAG: type IX secretion system membrane protein PorP/SprF [Sphingobacteriia bacterium]
MRGLFIFFLCCKFTGMAYAQDPHFSQFFSSPLTLNPAFTGKFFGAYRIAGNYRNQWSTIQNAFSTNTASIDFQIMQNKIANNDTWGVGFMGYSDNSAGGAVKFNYGSFSTAYHKGLDEDGMHQIGAGFQITYSNMLINTSLLNFEDQITIAGFRGISSEFFSGNTLKSNYIDLNAGLLYNGSTNNRNNFYLGVSMYHINRPKQSLTGAAFVLNPRTNFHAGGYFPIGYSTSLHISGIQMFQNGASETMLGAAVQINATPDEIKSTSIYIGSWMRLNDAIIPYAGLEFGDYRIGISYDYTTSQIKTASLNRGGIEVSLIYIRRPSTDRPINCPKF